MLTESHLINCLRPKTLNVALLSFRALIGKSHVAVYLDLKADSQFNFKK